MPEYILIDNERLKVMKAVTSLQAGEYWTEILCRNTDTTLDARDAKRFLTKYTDMELRMLYYNATGKVLPPNTEYGPTLGFVYKEVIQPTEIDQTPVSVLKDILGRDLEKDLPPVVHAPDNSHTQAVAPAKAKPASTGEGAPSKPRGGTTARVWELANGLYGQKAGWDLKELRKALIDACTEEGINQSTAGTQWSKWKRHQNL